MPRIVKELFYDGAQERIRRLGLSNLLEEVYTARKRFDLRVKEEKDANGGAALRKIIDARFEQMSNWAGRKSGDIDWMKCHFYKGQGELSLPRPPELLSVGGGTSSQKM